MPDILAQVTIPGLSGVPEDVNVNNWSFTVASLTEANFAQVNDGLLAFYTALYDEIYSATLNFDNLGLKIYARDDPEPRVPRAAGFASLGGGNLSLGSQPEEVAVCLSFKANFASGQPNARRRGRVYLGPLAGGVLSIVNNRTRCNLATREQIRDAYWLLQAQLTTVGNDHVVWSGVDEESRVVTELWIDDAFDTQRRRGPIATSRLAFPAQEP